MKKYNCNKSYSYKNNSSFGILAGTALATIFLVGTASANPQDGVVAAGNATITPVNSKQLDVNQTTDKAIINWGSFNVAADETTNFNQPSVNSITLNRIGGNNPSQILGTINATGQVMLVNPNGVFFGKSAKVDVGGLTATSANISDANFMNSNYAFTAAGKSNAQVINNGTIKVKDGGNVALVGPNAINNGTITANLGKVALAGTDVFTIDPVGDKLINFSLPAGTTRSGSLGDAAVSTNTGAIIADQGKVQLTAKAAQTTLDGIVNMSGIIQAQSSSTKKGNVFLSANRTTMSGNIDTSGEGNANGGAITVEGKKSVAMTGNIKSEGGISGGNGGNIMVKGNAMQLGGNAYVGAPVGKGGEATFQAGNTLNIGSSEAYTIANAVNQGGTINVNAQKTVNVNNAIEASTPAYAVKPASKTKKGGYPDVLNFGDSNNNNDLTVNLNADIAVPQGTALMGDATQVNVANTASIQDGIDVASTSGANVAIANGIYNENVNISKNDINLYDANITDDKASINGYVNVTGSNDTVDGFKITGGNLNGENIGINAAGATSVNIKNNDIDRAETGISLNNSSKAMITDNSIDHTNTAIKLTNSANAQVAYNNATNTVNGVNGNNADNLVYDHNTINGQYSNKGDALLLTDSANAKVTNNNHTDIKNKMRLVNSNTSLRTGNNF